MCFSFCFKISFYFIFCFQKKYLFYQEPIPKVKRTSLVMLKNLLMFRKTLDSELQKYIHIIQTTTLKATSDSYHSCKSHGKILHSWLLFCLSFAGKVACIMCSHHIPTYYCSLFPEMMYMQVLPKRDPTFQHVCKELLTCTCCQ